METMTLNQAATRGLAELEDFKATLCDTFDERSESWQESERGEEMQAHIELLEQTDFIDPPRSMKDEAHPLYHLVGGHVLSITPPSFPRKNYKVNYALHLLERVKEVLPERLEMLRSGDLVEASDIDDLDNFDSALDEFLSEAVGAF